MADSIPDKREALIVRDHFSDYRRGDCIEDQALINKIINSEHAVCVNKILLPAEQTKTTSPLKPFKKLKE